MSELPEVETIRRGLERLVVGKEVSEVKVLNAKSFRGSEGDLQACLVGARVTAVRRRAKVLIIDLNSDYSLVAHLKMTGQMVFRGDEDWAAGHPTGSFVANLPDNSTRMIFYLDDGSKLFYNDQRKFGWVRVLPTFEVDDIEFLKKLGPEPLTGDPKLPQIFLQNIHRHGGTTVKAAILNQTVVAGIGNIYADESLWMAKVHPATRVRDLSDAKLKKVLEAAIDVMTRSIESGGSTMKDYVRADGTKGNYLEKFANVFRREGQPCPRCGTVIEKIRVAGRGTHFCPYCQKLPKV
ncbi:MAG: bifunctional DNA-formamidopyrimidine glycosylase/DNA-(apurinic or apyrimidinic site) lyase [Candidatus Nomurabacteria bacterium]|jgi:formamidopyrimidine-DNA glycosylase|nr:bifunctional DNA-formamidopyrimidine glycosylase/DNA-(apurinic or apyrimidinic site) lyase [Candidatus Nomurabacteria bacterium]